MFRSSANAVGDYPIENTSTDNVFTQRASEVGTGKRFSIKECSVPTAVKCLNNTMLYTLAYDETLKFSLVRICLHSESPFPSSGRP